MRHPIFGFLAAAFLSACAAPAAPPQSPVSGNEQRTAIYLESLRDRPTYLETFLRRMPKGGDLHNHLSGAVYAESYVRWAAEDGLCVERATFTLTPPPCNKEGRMLARDALHDSALYSQLLDALSMRGFLPIKESGHDHFFATFGKFSAAQNNHFGDMLAEITQRAGEQSVSYIELMTSPGMAQARKIGAAVGWDNDLGRLRDRILASGGIGAAVAEARHEIDIAEHTMKRRLHCSDQSAEPGCNVTIRYLAQVIRVFPPEQVFAQCIFAYELAKADPRIVGLNLVAPEDDPTTLRYYSEQMRMLGFLHTLSPEVKLSLHAGEVTADLVPPNHLKSHIRGAVDVAAARRIGHGVDVLGEDDAPGLLAEMAKRRILVEINLTSNDVILGVYGARHPFDTYRRYGVPIALSTDDEGVSRIDLTHEYERALLTYRVGYSDLKTFARNSLEYAFLPGESLWKTTVPFVMAEACAGAASSGGTVPADCRELLDRSDKAVAQWRLESEFSTFEAQSWRPK